MRRILAGLVVLLSIALWGRAATAGEVAWGTCPAEVAAAMPQSANLLSDCATWTVPERWDRADGPVVELALARLRSVRLPAGSPTVVYLHGGPGGDALADASRWDGHPLLETAELILLDQRGGGRSRPLLCPDLEPEGDIAQGLAACAAAMTAAGRDPAGYTAQSIVEDVAALRQALGLTSWIIYGESNGTLLAQLLAARDPEGTRALVLDGPVPLRQAWSAVYAGIGDLLSRLFGRCAADTACAARFPRLEARFTAALQGMEPDDASWVVGSLHLAMYEDIFIPLVPLVAEMVADGDLTPIRILDRLIGESLGEMVGPNAALNCAHLDADLELGTVAGLAPLFGIVDLEAEMRADVAACDAWPVRVPLPDLPPMAVPALIVAGEWDPVTPPALGEVLRSVLPQARILVVKDGSHGAGALSDCGRSSIALFIRDPEVPLLPISCTGDAPAGFSLLRLQPTMMFGVIAAMPSLLMALGFLSVVATAGAVLGAILLLKAALPHGSGMVRTQLRKPSVLASAGAVLAGIFHIAIDRALPATVEADRTLIILGILDSYAWALWLPWGVLAFTAAGMVQWSRRPDLQPATAVGRWALSFALLLNLSVVLLARQLDLIAGV